MTTEPVSNPITVEEWHALVDAGMLDGRPVQLIDGRPFHMSPESARHSALMGELARQLDEGLRAASLDAHVRQQNPLTLSPRDEPEPDLAVVMGRPLDYRDHHPGPGAVLLVVEVSRSTRRMDLGPKAAAYARAGIAEYWVVDLTDDEVVRHRDPRGTRFADVDRHPFGRPIATDAGPVVTVPA